jgi:hypothetical protein
MNACPNQSFFSYFKENMEALGLDVPTSLFNTQTKAAWTIGSILGAVKTLGKGATLSEIAGATTGLERLAVLNAVSAAYYAGAAVGGFAVATGRYSSCGTSIADVLFDIRSHGVFLPVPMWMNSHFMRHPEIFDKKYPGRSTYSLKARAKR